MQILIVTSDKFPLWRVDLTVLFGQEFKSRGHQVDVFLQAALEDESSGKQSWPGGTAWVGPTSTGKKFQHLIKKSILGLVHDFRIFRVLRVGRYDAVVIKDRFLSGMPALLAAKLRGIRVVYWLSWPFPEQYLDESARSERAVHRIALRLRGLLASWALYRVLMPAADSVLVQSEQMRKDVAEKEIPTPKMLVVPMGVADDLLRYEPPARKPGDGRGEETRIVYLGTLDRYRRLDFLIRVHARVVERIPQAKLYLVGPGVTPADEQFLLDEGEALGIASSIVLTGRLEREDALSFVHSADVCVSPFFPTLVLNSTSPTKLVEYMALGKAVVANSHPEQSLLLGESGGGTCVPWDEEAFATAIIHLIEHPEEARSMGERGKNYVAAHRCYSRIAESVERELLRVINSDAS